MSSQVCARTCVCGIMHPHAHCLIATEARCFCVCFIKSYPPPLPESLDDGEDTFWWEWWWQWWGWGWIYGVVTFVGLQRQTVFSHLSYLKKEKTVEIKQREVGIKIFAFHVEQRCCGRSSAVNWISWSLCREDTHQQGLLQLYCPWRLQLNNNYAD